jgi:hypothetical protein
LADALAHIMPVTAARIDDGRGTQPTESPEPAAPAFPNTPFSAKGRVIIIVGAVLLVAIPVLAIVTRPATALGTEPSRRARPG